MNNQSMYHSIKELVRTTHFINWNPIQRCMLMLFLASVVHSLWLFWKIFVIFSPAVHEFVDVTFVVTSLYLNIAFIFIYFILIYMCFKFSKTHEMYTPIIFLCTSIFGGFLLWDAYICGVMSPATAIVMISVIALGLLLFEAKIIYPILTMTTVVIIGLVYFTWLGKVDYVPLFDFPGMHNSPYTNHFWCLSMLYFALPVVVICFAMFSIILHQWRNREASFKSMSLIDPLTKLLNRRSINQQLAIIEQKLTRQKQQCYGIIILDLDHFKRINDSYGHMIGDEVLIEVAEALQSNVRQADMLGRYGGEEFIIVVKNTDKNIIMQLAHRCQRSIQKLQICTGKAQPLRITASFGVTLVCQNQSMKNAIQQADDAMYQAKQNGRDLIVLSDQIEDAVAVAAG